MKIGVLGTGIVGRTVSTKLAELGHEVILGTRDVDALLTRHEQPAYGESFDDWRARNPDLPLGTFAESAAHSQIVFHATAGGGSLEALNAPSLSVVNTDSLGEQIQRAFPGAKVVKTLNTVNAAVMVDPRAVGNGDHHAFVSGNDAGAKTEVTTILRDWFGWQHVMDLGDITTARGPEMLLALWLRLLGVFGNGMFNLKVVI